jgi:hypothetical protein
MAFVTVTTHAINKVGRKKEQYLSFIANAATLQVRTKLKAIDSVEVNTYSMNGSASSVAQQAMGTILDFNGTIKAPGVIHVTDLVGTEPVVMRVTGR